GSSPAARRGAPGRGGGGLATALPPADVAERAAGLRARCEAAGRDPASVRVTLRRRDTAVALRRDRDAYRAAGLEDLVVGLPRGHDLDESARALEEVLGALA